MKRRRDPRGLVLVLALPLAACTAEGFTGYESAEPWTSAECLECHGTRGAGDTTAALEADIVDTHYDDQFIGPDGDLIHVPNTSGDGYILDSEVDWSLSFPPGTTEQENPPGYVVEGGANQCGAGCHFQHDDHGLLREQYASSAHANRTTHWLDTSWDGFPSSICFQCHSSAGFALYTDPTTPSWRPPAFGRPLSAADEPGGDLITCNTCHTGDGEPSGREPLLRTTGDFTLASGAGGPPPNTLFVDGVVNAGRNAVCMVCHSARESGGSLFKAMVIAGVDPYDGVEETMSGRQFIDSHYQAAGAVLFSAKAYEVPGKRYTTGNLFHQSAGCIGCHMSDSEEPDIGGHSLNATRRGSVRDNATCKECHGSTGRIYGEVGEIGPALDVDGDGRAESPVDELEGLYETIIAELAGQGVNYDPHSYPYAFNIPGPAIFPNRKLDWTESQLIATFNVHYFSHETGAHVHNYVYAAQVLRDSLELLRGAEPAGTRPTSSYDREATSYAR